jgi:phosphinothricin acetyltransferase
MSIRDVCDADAEALVDIYNHYIRHTAATFEERVLEPAEFRQRIADVVGLGLPWLVAEKTGERIGYAYANRWRERSAYRFSVETTVYLHPGHTGGGWGTALYRALFARLRRGGLHAAIGGITLPNPASVALHESLGMRQVAHFPQVGFKQGRWLDVGYWQICFDPDDDVGT